MKKAFGQTVRDIKREVNKKVLKVPSVEQKVLDATSNEPWGPHGLLLSDIAQATRNHHEYQMITGVLWKRINDTGKNWRHVYKALTVLEYLVAHGSERVIDEIREHAYQISTLSDFQYIDSSGRDQGNNVRKKSQSLVVLVNDKERIQEVRQKAASNRDKYRNTSTGNMNQYDSNSNSGEYGDRYDGDRYDGRYGNRDDDRVGYRDDERYGRYGESYGREGDKYSRDYEDRHSQDGSRDDDYRGRGIIVYGSRGGSADFDKDRAYEDEGQYSLRGSGAKDDGHSQDGSTAGKRLDRKNSEQKPPSYEEAISATHSPSYSERKGESSRASAAIGIVPPSGASPSHEITVASPPQVPASPPAQVSAPDTDEEVNGFDEFDPRGSFSATSATSNGFAPATSADKEIDILGSLSESFSSNSLALVPATEPTMTPETQASANFSSGSPFAATSSASTNPNQRIGLVRDRTSLRKSLQPAFLGFTKFNVKNSNEKGKSFDDPFGDGPFKAFPSTYKIPAQEQLSAPSSSFNPHSSQIFGVNQPAQMAGTEFISGHDDSSYVPSVPLGVQPPTNSEFAQQDDSSTFNQDIDILADILPPSIPSGYPVPANQNVTLPPHANQLLQSCLPSLTNQNSFQRQTGQHPGFPSQLGQPPPQTSYPLQSAESASQTSILAHSMALTFPAQSGPPSQMGYYSQNGQTGCLTGFQSQMGYSNSSFQAPLGGQSALPNPPNPNFYGIHQLQDVSTGPDSTNVIPSGGHIVQHNFQSQIGSAVPTASLFGPQAPQVRPSNIPPPVSSIPASIGSSVMVPQPSKDKFETKSTVWADTLSRGLVNLNISGSKTNPLADIGVDFDAINRKEKRMEKPTTVPVTSTITMGKAMGSGSGMGRAGASALRPPPNAMMGPSMNMTGVPGAGMGVAGGYGVNQPMVQGMGMNMGMGRGMSMQQQAGFPPGSAMPGGYNPMMGAGNYSQRPYGGGY